MRLDYDGRSVTVIMVNNPMPKPETLHKDPHPQDAIRDCYGQKSLSMKERMIGVERYLRGCGAIFQIDYGQESNSAPVNRRRSRIEFAELVIEPCGARVLVPAHPSHHMDWPKRLEDAHESLMIDAYTAMMTGNMTRNQYCSRVESIRSAYSRLMGDNGRSLK